MLNICEVFPIRKNLIRNIVTEPQKTSDCNHTTGKLGIGSPFRIGTIKLEHDLKFKLGWSEIGTSIHLRMSFLYEICHF